MDTFGEFWDEQYGSFHYFEDTPGNFNNVDHFDQQSEDQQQQHSNEVFTPLNQEDSFDALLISKNYIRDQNLIKIQQSTIEPTTKRVTNTKSENKQKNDITDQLDQSSHIQLKQIQSKLEKFGAYNYYPGDTKNIPKNFGGHLKTFIQNILKDNNIECRNKEWINFCAIKNQKISKAILGKFLQTDFGNKFGTPFFGNYQWAQLFLAENKSDIEQYFKFNQYRKKVKLN